MDVWADILKAANDGSRKTHIIYEANLNFKSAKKYFAKLMEHGLLENRDIYYITTPEGKQFLEGYDKFVSPFKRIPGS